MAILLPYDRWEEIRVPAALLRALPPGAEHPQAFAKGILHAIRTVDCGRLHLSVSTQTRLPSWEELKDARTSLTPPGTFLCQAFPPEEYWVNDHPYTLHLWEIRDATLVRMWRHEAGAGRMG